MKQEKSIRLGVAPIAWSNDDLPELGGDTPLDVCLRESRAAGFSGVESGGKFPMDASVLGPILEKHGLRLASGWYSGRLREISFAEEKESIERQLDTFQRLGAPVIIYGETSGTVQSSRGVPLSARPRIAPDGFPAYGEKLSALGEYTASRGVPLSIHPHMGTAIETEEELNLLMAHTGPAVGLLLDTGHLRLAGGDIARVVRRHQARINHVHCKDVRTPVLAEVARDDLSFLDAVLKGAFTVPGDGAIDFDEVALLLAEIGYEGWAVVEAEQDPAKANPFEYAKLGYRTLTNALLGAGYEIVS